MFRTATPIFIFATSLIAFTPSTALSKMYQWKDGKGNTHFTDNPKKIPRKYRRGSTQIPDVDETQLEFKPGDLLKDKPDSSRHLLNLRLKASSLMLKRDYPGAEKIYGDLIKADPDHGYAYIHKGFAKMKGGDRKGGRELIKKGIALEKSNSKKDPENGELLYNIATGYRYLSDHKNAIAHLKQAIKLSPKRKNYQLDLQAIKLEAKMKSNSKKNQRMMDNLEHKLNTMEE